MRCAGLGTSVRPPHMTSRRTGDAASTPRPNTAGRVTRATSPAVRRERNRPIGGCENGAHSSNGPSEAHFRISRCRTMRAARILELRGGPPQGIAVLSRPYGKAHFHMSMMSGEDNASHWMREPTNTEFAPASLLAAWVRRESARRTDDLKEVIPIWIGLDEEGGRERRRRLERRPATAERPQMSAGCPASPAGYQRCQGESSAVEGRAG